MSFTSTFKLNDKGEPITELPWVFASGIAHAAISRAVQVDYTGNGVNDRDISMGTECDFVIVVSRESYSTGQNHGALAYAFGNAYGVLTHATAGMGHASGAAANQYFQGLQTGTPNVRLGNNAASSYGFNLTGKDYRIIGFKFRR